MKMVKNVFADYFAVDAYDGMVARLKRGELGLVRTEGRGVVKEVRVGEGVGEVEVVEAKMPVVEMPMETGGLTDGKVGGIGMGIGGKGMEGVTHQFVEVAVPTA